MHFESEINLYTSVDGHTENVYDVAFCDFKKTVRTTDIYTPKPLIRCMSQSHDAALCVVSGNVQFRNWKAILDSLFKLPSNFKIQKHHHFIFSCSDLGVMLECPLCSNDELDRFCYA